MNIRTILKDENLTNEKKLESITEIVSSARTAYGNTELTISEPIINTVNGLKPVSLMSTEDKLHLVTTTVENIFNEALAIESSVEGVVIDKVVEQLIATSPLLTNLAKTVSIKYL